MTPTPPTSARPAPDHRVIAAGLTHVAPHRRGVRRRIRSMLRTADRTYARLVSACGYDPYC